MNLNIYYKLLNERKEVMYKTISINNYKKLTQILKKKKLLDLDGNIRKIEEYCKNGTYCKINYRLSTVYTGLLIDKLKNLTNYQIVILMLGQDTFSYDVFRGKNGYFKVIVYKTCMKRGAQI